MGIPRLATETVEIVPPAVLASDAYAAGEITSAEYSDAFRVIELADAIKSPICEATWRDVKVGDLALVVRFGLIEKVRINAVAHNTHSVLVDYVIDGRSYHGMMYAPSQTAYIQQR